MAGRTRTARRADVARPAHHLQARCSEATAQAIATLADERGISASELVRDIVEAFVFGQAPGSTIQGTDQGYRIAKSTANVIARKALHAAFESLPTTFEEWKAMMEAEEGTIDA